jgi:hypothetical protein
MRFAQREFAGAGDGAARIMAALEWIHRNIDYVAGVSNAETTAERTFVYRAGVCRDFTHLGITLARALGNSRQSGERLRSPIKSARFPCHFRITLANFAAPLRDVE